MTSHFSGNGCQDVVSVLEENAERRVRKDFAYSSFDFDRVLAHPIFTSAEVRTARTLRTSQRAGNTIRYMRKR